MKPLMATFRPQAYINDFAVDIDDGGAEFDAADIFLALDLDKIQGFKEHNYDSDELALDLPEFKGHNGPFEVDTDIDAWLEEHGVKGGREGMTQEHLDRLRKERAVLKG